MLTALVLLVLAVAARTQKPSANVTLNNYANVAYWADIELGTPDQRFRVALDTASSITFVPSIDCDETCKNKNRYNSGNSSSFVGDGTSWTYEQDPTIRGYLSVDSLKIGGSQVQYQTFAEATTMKSYAMNTTSEYDGVLALGFQNDSMPNTVLTNLKKAGIIQSDTFGLWLSRDLSSCKSVVMTQCLMSQTVQQLAVF